MPDYKINVVLDPAKAASGIKKIDKGLEGVQGEARKASAEMKNIGREASVAGDIMSRVFSTVALAATINVLRNYSQEMSSVRAITGATGEQFDALNAKAKELGSTTRFSASQAAQGMQFLAKAGFDTNEVLGSIGGTLQLAQVGMLDLGSAADIASNVLSGMQLNVDQTGRVVDVLAATANKANTDVRALGESFKYAAPLSAGLGIEIEDVSAAFGALGDNALKGSTAGTGLVASLASLTNVTTQGRQVLQDLGLTVDQVSVKQNGLINVLNTLNKAGLTSAQALVLAGRRGGLALSVLTQNVDRIRELGGVLRESSGFAAETAKVMDDNLNGSFLSLLSATEGLILALGEAGITAALRALIDAVTTVIRAITPLAPLITGLATAIGINLATSALPLAIAGMRTWLASLLTVPAAATAATVSTGFLTSGVRALALAMASNPLGLFGTALLGIAITLGQVTGAFGFLYTAVSNLTTFISGIVNVVLLSFRQALQAIGINLEQSTIGFGILTAAIVAFLPQMLTLATTMLGTLVPALVTTGSTLASLAVGALSSAVAGFKALGVAMANPKILAITAVIVGLTAAIVVLTGNTEKAIKVYREFSGTMKDTADEAKNAGDAVEDMAKRVEDQKKSIIESRKNAEAYALAMADLGDETQGASSAAASLNNQLQTQAPLAQSAASNLGDAADNLEKFKRGGEDAKDVFERLNKVLDGMQDTLETLVKSWNTLAAQIVQAAKAASASGINSGSASVQPGLAAVCAQCDCSCDSKPSPEPGAPGGPPSGSMGGTGGTGSSSSSGNSANSNYQTSSSTLGLNLGLAGTTGSVGGSSSVLGAIDSSLQTYTSSELTALNEAARAAAENTARLTLGYEKLNEYISAGIASGTISAAQAASTFAQGTQLLSRALDDPTVVSQLQAAGETVYSSIIDQVLKAAVDTSKFIEKSDVRKIGDPVNPFGGRVGAVVNASGKGTKTAGPGGTLGGNGVRATLLSAMGFDSSANPFEFISQFAGVVDATTGNLLDLNDGLGGLGGGIGSLTTSLNDNTNAILETADRYTLAEKNISAQYRAGLPLPAQNSNNFASGSSAFDQQNYSLDSGRGTGGNGVNVNGVTIYANGAEEGRQAALAFQNELARVARRGSRRTD
jgi:TP901 family phage tail tape measure protein